MAIQRSSFVFGVLCSTLLFAAALSGQASAHSVTQTFRVNGLPLPSASWDRQAGIDAVQADAWFENYKFLNGENLERLRIHYATLGTPHRNAQCDIDNAVLVLHWTGADSRALLAPSFMKALFDPGRPLDARHYYLIFIDNV
ncbi:hypothetical protein K0U00_15175, partial [Paenibacillus sepulcri]|nr:hypothetical protein [Paenibacillus sepulcri]